MNVESLQKGSSLRKTFSRKMRCPKTKQLEDQETIRESEDGITLRCQVCGEEHSHEIGEVADWF